MGVSEQRGGGAGRIGKGEGRCLIEKDEKMRDQPVTTVMQSVECFPYEGVDMRGRKGGGRGYKQGRGGDGYSSLYTIIVSRSFWTMKKVFLSPHNPTSTATFSMTILNGMAINAPTVYISNRHTFFLYR